MKFSIVTVIAFLPLLLRAEVVSASFDMQAVRDASTLETRVIQDWRPVASLPGVKQKLVEITVCEWWPGQKLRLPVTFCAPDRAGPCHEVVLGNMGLAPKVALPAGVMRELLVKHGVGVVLAGMGTIDAMEPKGELHLGMQAQLLKTKDARYTPAWIWGMSDMRALTAAMAEKEMFQPKKVLATGGSKRGVGAAICGIHDERFTAILPVVAPILGNPGGAYVKGSALLEEAAQNEAFLVDLPSELPATAPKSLLDREQRRAEQSITKQAALAAGWSEAEMLQMNDVAWDACRIAMHWDRVKQRGLKVFYHVGTNDNVCPALRMLGEKLPDFPLYILPGGQHGGPKSSGFTLQTPGQPEAEENLMALARHHFFGHRPLPGAPQLKFQQEGEALKVTVRLAPGHAPVRSRLSWCEDRSLPYTLAAEFDHWQSVELKPAGESMLSASIPIQPGKRRIDLISTHSDSVNGIPFHVSSAYRRWEK